MKRIGLALAVIAGLGLSVSGPAGRGEVKKPAFDWAKHPVNRWVKHSPRPGAPAPQFSWEGSGAYDPHRRIWIHQGGHDGIPQGFHLFTCDLETGVWRQHFPNTSPPGVCCVDGANVFAVAHRRFVRFPGASLGHGWQWSRGVRLKDSPVWLYDPAADRWTNMRPPPYRRPAKYSRRALGALNAGGAYDARHEVALSFGGQTSGGGTNNLFVYDAYANRLERLTAANPPSERDGMGLAYDMNNDCLVMFGSQYGQDERTWVYRYAANKWVGHDLTPHPPGKKAGTYATIPKMAYDPLHRVCLCVTWDSNTGKHQTWGFDAARLRWTNLKPDVLPAPSLSRSRNLGFSPEHNVFLLETIVGGQGPQLWTYRYGKAPPDQRPLPPTNLTLTTRRGSARLIWTASQTPRVREYRVYRAESDRPWQTKFVKIGTTRKTEFTDKGLRAGKVYFYRVKAVAGTAEGRASALVRTQPRVLLDPVVSVLNARRVEITWKPHPAKDVAGYNVYRGQVSVATVKRGKPAPWRDNDPAYPEPVVVAVKDITGLRKLNAKPLADTRFVDTGVDLGKKGAESGDYRFAVYAYVLRAVNRLGTESGPSPYALTLPSEPANVLVREKDGRAELKWDRPREKGIVGFRIYKKGKGPFDILRYTDKPFRANRFIDKTPGGVTRYWVVAVDALGQEGQPSSPVWNGHRYKGFYRGDWHQ
jgi:hypothetical protein